MIIIKGILSILWLILIPTILGFIITRKMEKYKNSIILSWILGYMIEFGIFEFLSVPLSLITDSFYPLLILWLLSIGIIVGFSIKYNYKRIKEILVENIKEIKKLPILLTIIAILMVGIQAYVPFRYMHLDDDDSNFVAKATVTYQTNTLYKYTDTGEVAQTKDIRHELATYPIYTALISKLIMIHPAITAHTIFPVIFIPMAYLIYILIAKNLFDDNKKKIAVFTILLSFIYIWGFYSLDTNFCFLLYRIWQGKAMVANVAVPLLWLLYLEYSKSGRKNIYWLSLIIIMAGANVLSSMAVPIMSITLFSLTLAYFIKDKKITDFLKSAVSVIPCIICAILFLILK